MNFICFNSPSHKLFAPHTDPDIIENLKVSEVTKKSVCLAWDRPSGNISFFKLQWTFEKRTYVTTNGTFYRITDLKPGVTYTICITAVTESYSSQSKPFCESVMTGM